MMPKAELRPVAHGNAHQPILMLYKSFSVHKDQSLCTEGPYKSFAIGNGEGSLVKLQYSGEKETITVSSKIIFLFFLMCPVCPCKTKTLKIVK